VEEIFGTATERGNGGDNSAYTISLTATPLFQSIVLATLVLYLTILLRSWGFIRSIWSDIFRTNNEARMVFEGGELPLQRFKLTASILGITLVALTIIRIAEYNISSSSDILMLSWHELAPLGALLIMTMYVVWHVAYHKIVGWVIGNDSLNMLAYIGHTNFARTVVLLYPFTTVWLLTEQGDSAAAAITLIVCTSVLLLLYLKDTFVFFLGKKISILYWILYLCTAILLPWSFIAKMLGM
jgi:Ca2+/Na+ antiporter